MEIDLKKTYLAYIENSIGSKIFRNNYFTSEKSVDISENGQLSCAFFVSSILYLFELITKRHATVKSTIEDMQSSGWKKVIEPKKGDIVFWEKDVRGHYHLGFYYDADTAISNRSKTGIIEKHSLNYKRKRDVLSYYRWKDF